jgi:hypothetical protein
MSLCPRRAPSYNRAMMRSKTMGLAIAGSLLLHSATGAFGQQVKLEKTVLKDPAVGNIEGATLLLPEGWKLEGGFVWMPLLSMQANLLIRVTDPATGSSVEVLPSQQFNWPTRDMGLAIQPGSNWNGSILRAPPKDAAEFVQAVLAAQALPHLRGVTPVKTEALPTLAAEHARATPPKFTVRSTRLRYAFEVAGKPWEEAVTVTLTQAPLNGWTAMWWCGGFTMRAPAGQLDKAVPTLSVPIQSIRISLAWHARLEEVRKVFSQGLLQNQEDFARFQQRWTQSQKEIQELHRKTWEERAASQDRQNFALREILGGVETYRNPHESRNVELPQGYKKYWINKEGTVLLSSDPNYDPRPGNTADWREMERSKP